MWLNRRNRRLFRSHRQIRLDYPASANPGPRWGHGKPVHGPIQALLDSHRETYAAWVDRLLPYAADFAALPMGEASPPDEPRLDNAWFFALDSFFLYALVRETRPRRYTEIGSGNSTRFAHRAKRDAGIGMEMLSVDPEPREGIDRLCDRVLRRPLEEVDLGFLDSLGAGDILFLDGSHRCFQNSDVTVFFLNVLPRLKEGVLIHVHDIFWPEDYPPDFTDRWYSEQYLLGVQLLAGPDRAAPFLPAHYLTLDPEMRDRLQPLEEQLAARGLPLRGSSFWMQKAAIRSLARSTR